jgi:hypothetical protein
MNKDEFEAKFKQGGAAAVRFHTVAAAVLTKHPIVFWPVLLLAVYGLVRVFV